MRKADILPNGSAQHGCAFVRWIKAGVVVAAMLAAGFAAVALAGGNSVRSDGAASAEPAEYMAAEKRLERSGNFFSYDVVY